MYRMHELVCRAAVVTVVALGVLLDAGQAAAQISKEQCVEAHSKGQDAREQGKLTLARKLFLTCAVSTCPALVQGDCARFSDDLGRAQPSLTFAARTSTGADLPDTTVYVDDALVATRLDGGAFELDPGKHVLRFQRGRDEQTLTVVVNTGEKGRAIVATFAPAGGAPMAPVMTDAAPVTPAAPAVRGTRKPTGAKVLIGAGAVLLVGGAALAGYGYFTLPEGCSLSSHECAASPGSDVFDDAASKVKLGNIGAIAAGAGAAVLISGLAWYLTHDDAEVRPATVGFAPWLAPGGAGVALSGPL